jgi:hypothetical protein
VSDVDQVRVQLQEPYAGMLRSIGITDPDPDDELHQDLIDAIRDTWGQPTGRAFVAMRFRTVNHLRKAGQQYGVYRAAYDHLIDDGTVTLMDGPPPMSKTEAALRTRASDRAHELHEQYLVTEKREQYLRKLLDAFDMAMDNYQTDAANARRVDTFHAAGHDGAS